MSEGSEEKSEAFREFIDYYRDWRFHGFNHDMNDAHGVPAHAALIALAELDRRKLLEELGDKVLEQDFIVSPGMLHLAILDSRIPADMVIAEVSTESFKSPLYVPVKGRRVWVDGIKTEQPFVSEGKETSGIEYHFRLSAPDLSGMPSELFGNGGVKVVAFPDSTPTKEIFGYFEQKFSRMMDTKNNAIDSAGKTTDITGEHDVSKAKSIRPSCIPRERRLQLPARRLEAISQLELLAKMPRVFSIYIDKVENGESPYIKRAEPMQQHLAYAEMEKKYGWVEDASARASQLAGKFMYVYVSQDAVFNPQVRCHVGDRFDLTTYLTKAGRLKHTFTSQMALDTGCAYADLSTFMAAPAFSGNVAEFLMKREIDIAVMGRFESLKENV